MEPNIIDYYNKYPLNINVIDKMNEEHHLLMDENEKKVSITWHLK